MALPAPSSRRPSLVVALAVLVSCIALAQSVVAQTSTVREYQIKAVFLFNFGQFVTWGPDDFPDATSPFVIGVLGEDPFGATLDAIVEGESVQGRPVQIERYVDVDDVGSCHILFVSGSELPRLDRVFERLRGRGILTVGETEGFAERSGMIRFVVVDNRLRLEINAAAAERAGLAISSRLLSLADVVRTEQE